MQRYLLTLSAFKYFASVSGFNNLSDTCNATCSPLFMIRQNQLPDSDICGMFESASTA